MGILVESAVVKILNVQQINLETTMLALAVTMLPPIIATLHLAKTPSAKVNMARLMVQIKKRIV